MADLTQNELLALARTAQLRIPDEDVEHLTMRFNALMEAMEVLGQYPLDDIKALPSLAHPFELPFHSRESGPAPSLATETDAPLAYKSITELSHLIRTRNLSPVELTDLYLQRIGQYDGELKSYITVLPEIARREAEQAERALADGSALGPLHGIPLAYKDEFYTKGVRTTCGSLILSDFVPDYDATAVVKLHEAGAVMLGKLNMTEWATPLTLEFPYGQPRNPWNLEYDAGGSSTGSGIATTAALCAGALGEDTGGSIRRPAANNSCVGLRPSWGRVSMHGVIPAVWSQDTAGPLVRTVADCALLMNVIAGYDPNDPITANLPVPDYTAVLDGNIRGMRVGVVKETMEAAHLHPEVKSAVAEALRRFEGLGATVEEVSIPTITLSGVISGAGGSDRTALQWKHLMHSPEQYDAVARRFNLLPGLLPAACTSERFNYGICCAGRYLKPASALMCYCRHIRPRRRRGFKISRCPLRRRSRRWMRYGSSHFQTPLLSRAFPLFRCPAVSPRMGYRSVCRLWPNGSTRRPFFARPTLTNRTLLGTQ